MGADLGIPDGSVLNRDAGFSPVDSKGNLMPGIEIGLDGKPIYKMPNFNSGEQLGENYVDRFKDFYGGGIKETTDKIGGFLGRNKIARDIAGFSAALGVGGPVGGFTYGMGRLGQLLGMNQLQKKADEMKAQVAVKQEQERQARAAEAARQAQEAQATLNASRNAAAAKPQYVAQNRTVQVQAPFDPNYYIRQLPQPQRSQSAIQNVLQSPFRKNSKLPF